MGVLLAEEPQRTHEQLRVKLTVTVGETTVVNSRKALLRDAAFLEGDVHVVGVCCHAWTALFRRMGFAYADRKAFTIIENR
jgi:hypothetical protein